MKLSAPVQEEMLERCDAALLMVSYTGDNLVDLPVNASAPVLGPAGGPVASNWSALFTGAALAETLAEASVLPSGSPWWSGSTGSVGCPPARG